MFKLTPVNLLHIDIKNPLRFFPRLGGVYIHDVQGADYDWSAKSKQGENQVLFQYTLAGEGGFSVHGVEQLLPTGTGFLTCIKDPAYRYFYPATSREKLRVLWLSVYGTTICQQTAELNNRYGYVFSMPQDRGIIARFKNLLSLPERRLTLEQGVCSQLVSELLSSCIAAKQPDCHLQAGEKMVERALEIIARYPNRLLKISELAGEMSVSREHLCRLFREYMKTSPYQFIINQKIEQAKVELRYSHKTVKEIAHELGFTSNIHFTRLFKAKTGLPPPRVPVKCSGCPKNV
jgi:AraC-like DNA-binding protein